MNIQIHFPLNTEEIENEPELRLQNQMLMEELSRPKVERYDSQLMSQQIQIAFEQNPANLKDEVIRKKSTDFWPSSNPSVNVPDKIKDMETERALKRVRKVSMNSEHLESSNNIMIF